MTARTASLTDLYAPVRKALAAAERIFDAEIASDLPFVNELCDTVRSYRGKMLRPALLLLSAKASGQIREEHPTLAAVVEMVHMATLVHDDVLDEAEQRRSRPTIAALAGNTGAVLLGDYLISHAFHLCSSLQSQYASRRIGATTNTVCEGEMLQDAHRGRLDVSEATYRDIIGRKTGALTAVCCELGARFAGADEGTVAAMCRFGLLAGIAFQIVDDILDIEGDPQELGKPLGRDAGLGTLTLPTIHALTHGSPRVAAAIRSALQGRARPTPAQWMEWLAPTASLDHARATARQDVCDALAALDPLPPSEAKASLTALAEFILQRRR